jgi:DNA-binding XRE family transcriptional regulator
MDKHPRHRNLLWISRKKAGLGQKTVARMLGYKSTSPVSEYETGRLLPGLRTAFKLAILLDRPIKELYAPLYKEVEAEIQARRKTCAPTQIPPSFNSTL